MATLLEKTEFVNDIASSFKSVKATGERIVGLIQAAKQAVTANKASIASSAILTAEEKTEMTGEYTSRLNQVKADILAEFGL